jgi:uncharacterized membrane protein
MNEPSAPPPPPEQPPSPPPPPTGSGGASSNTLMLVLSYLGVLALIPFLVEKDDKEVQWHAKHGLVLFGAEVVLFIGLSIVFRILDGMTSGAASCLGGCGFMPILSLAIMVLHIVCIVKAVNGQRFKIPVLSDYADKF